MGFSSINQFTNAQDRLLSVSYTHLMEIWVIPVETGNTEKELSNVNGSKTENLSQY